MQPKRLLVVEDEPAHAELIAMGFRRNSAWILEFADNLEQAQRQLSEGEFHMVLADLNLPDGQATDLCESPLPVVIMTSQGDEAHAIEALRGGALDYVVKDAQTLRAMPAVIRRAHRRSTLIEARQHAERELQAKQQELERNNRRLEKVLESARQLARTEDPKEAERLIGGVVCQELEAVMHQVQGPVLSDVQLSAPGLIRAPLPTTQGATTVEFRRTQPFDSAELGLVRMAMGLVRETVRGLEAQRALRHSERRLHQADKLRSVGQLAGGIAHDFNNMLTAILTSTELLRLDLEQSGGSAAHLEQLDFVTEASQHAAQLTRQLLTFSRGGSAVRAPVSVRETLTKVERLLEHSLPTSVHLRIAPCEALFVHCDGSLLQTALLNLCLNARDAMPSGGHIWVSARAKVLSADFIAEHMASDKTDTFVEFEVRDEGQGMDEETQRRIFEPFFTTKRSGHGTGLGLPVVFGTVIDADGGVTVESAPGQGATFRAYLPLLASDATAASPPEDTPALRPLRSLVVDDNAGVLRATRRLLESLGHQTESSPDALRALEMAQAGDFDLLVVDLVMPGMGGIELVDRLLGSGFSGQVVLMSGYSEENAQLRRLRLEHKVGFLGKPFTREQLERCIEGLTKQAGADSGSER